MLFQELPDSSRVWVYQSQTPLSKEGQQQIQQKTNAFMAQWAAHGNKLFGAGAVLDDYFLVLVVNEDMVAASGCSIDSSVHFVRSLEKEFGLDLFNRLNVLIEDKGVKSIVHFSDLKQHPEALVYHPMIQNLKELREGWKVKVSESGLV